MNPNNFKGHAVSSLPTRMCSWNFQPAHKQSSCSEATMLKAREGHVQKPCRQIESPWEARAHEELMPSVPAPAWLPGHGRPWGKPFSDDTSAETEHNNKWWLLSAATKFWGDLLRTSSLWRENLYWMPDSSHWGISLNSMLSFWHISLQNLSLTHL